LRISYAVIVVVAVEHQYETLEVEPLWLLGIALGLVDLADHPIVHSRTPWRVIRNKKARGETRCLFSR
jgi:hypothetical protein